MRKFASFQSRALNQMKRPTWNENVQVEYCIEIIECSVFTYQYELNGSLSLELKVVSLDDFSLAFFDSLFRLYFMKCYTICWISDSISFRPTNRIVCYWNTVYSFKFWSTTTFWPVHSIAVEFYQLFLKCSTSMIRFRYNKFCLKII